MEWYEKEKTENCGINSRNIGMYKYYNEGTLVEYTVEETPIEESLNYETPLISGSQTEGYTVTNTHYPEKIKIPVEKIWTDEDNRDNRRPTSVTIKLFADGVDTKKELTLNAEKSWKGEFTDLYRYKEGKVREEIEYTIQEVEIDSKLHYEEPEITPSELKGSSNNLSSGFTVTNTYGPEKININVTKTWDDDDNRDGLRGDVKVYLYAESSVRYG